MLVNTGRKRIYTSLKYSNSQKPFISVMTESFPLFASGIIQNIEIILDSDKIFCKYRGICEGKRRLTVVTKGPWLG